MIGSSDISLDISIIETRGAFGSVGKPTLFLWCRCERIPAISKNTASLTMLQRNQQSGEWHEHAPPVTTDAFDILDTDIKSLGLYAQTPRLEPTLDTSDCWSTVQFQFRRHQRSHAFTLTMANSSYEGTDAEPFRTIMGDLFALVGPNVATACF